MKMSQIIYGLTMCFSISTQATPISSRYSPEVTCRSGLPFIHGSTWDTGCYLPQPPFFKTLLLQSVSPKAGKIGVELDFPLAQKNPYCQNPRGMPFPYYLPLPIEKGSWEVHIANGRKFLVTLDSGCTVVPIK